jgi:hypothetical protein
MANRPRRNWEQRTLWMARKYDKSEPLAMLKQRQNLQISLTEESASYVCHPGERYLSHLMALSAHCCFGVGCG